MTPVRIEGFTRILGEQQGFIPLPVLDVVKDDPVLGANAPVMITGWQPTPEEIDRMAAGALIFLMVNGTAHPPVMIAVGQPPNSSDGDI